MSFFNKAKEIKEVANVSNTNFQTVTGLVTAEVTGAATTYMAKFNMKLNEAISFQDITTDVITVQIPKFAAYGSNQPVNPHFTAHNKMFKDALGCNVTLTGYFKVSKNGHLDVIFDPRRDNYNDKTQQCRLINLGTTTITDLSSTKEEENTMANVMKIQGKVINKSATKVGKFIMVQTADTLVPVWSFGGTRLDDIQIGHEVVVEGYIERNWSTLGKKIPMIVLDSARNAWQTAKGSIAITSNTVTPKATPQVAPNTIVKCDVDTSTVNTKLNGSPKALVATLLDTMSEEELHALVTEVSKEQNASKRLEEKKAALASLEQTAKLVPNTRAALQPEIEALKEVIARLSKLVPTPTTEPVVAPEPARSLSLPKPANVTEEPVEHLVIPDEVMFEESDEFETLAESCSYEDFAAGLDYHVVEVDDNFFDEV